MSNRLVLALKGSLASLVLVGNVLFFVTLMMPVALLKLLLPFTAARRVADRGMVALATCWVSVNNAWIAAVGRTRWDVQGLDGLNPRGWYLVSVNHQSWVDILVLQKVFQHRIPFLKFFLKQELIWVPVIGLAWWALDFPFMRRKAGSSATDLATTRRACEKFKLIPTSVINFVEGTRFTRAKHRRQGSPYANLLKPKVGGMAVALATLGDEFDALLDVTIVYPQGTPTFWDLLSGQVKEVAVRVQAREIPPDLIRTDYQSDPQFRAQMQAWVNGMWLEKDRLIEELKRPA
ncbi:MAG: acyltransferase [Burkholderiaceae bacterium]